MRGIVWQLRRIKGFLPLVSIVEVKTGDIWRNIRRELDRLHVGFFKSSQGSFSQTASLTAGQEKI